MLQSVDLILTIHRSAVLLEDQRGRENSWMRRR
jgi:hypothetical protein